VTIGRSDLYDVVVVGGGAVGSAVAFHLTRERGLRVAIIERDTSYAQCSTSRSAGGVRQQFSTAENIALSQATLTLLASLRETFGADADVSFRRQGYLLLASEHGRDVLARNVATQREAGAAIHWIDGCDLAARFPWIVPAGIAAGSFGADGEGWIDPVALMTLMRKAAVAAGAEIINANVIGIEQDGKRAIGVQLSDGRKLGCGSLVNAAGAWSGALAKLAGISLPVEPRKRYVFVIDSRRATEPMRAGPLTVDITGVWMRPEGRTFLCGISPDEASEPPAADLDHIDYTEFEEIVWPTLAARMPAFEEAKVLSAWAGFYDYNTLDQNAIIGAHPGLTNLYFANGFSGHGLQQAYGAGRAIAELIVHGRFRTIDLERFGYGRVVRGEPLFELNVI
jgi:FAD-dependent oxidoreductase domain-containing protein 1